MKLFILIRVKYLKEWNNAIEHLLRLVVGYKILDFLPLSPEVSTL